MKFVNPEAKKHSEDQIKSLREQIRTVRENIKNYKESQEAVIAALAEEIEATEARLITWEAEEYKGEEPQEVETSGGKMVVNKGDFVFKSEIKVPGNEQRVMVVPGQVAHNTEFWVPLKN